MQQNWMLTILHYSLILQSLVQCSCQMNAPKNAPCLHSHLAVPSIFSLIFQTFPQHSLVLILPSSTFRSTQTSTAAKMMHMVHQCAPHGAPCAPVLQSLRISLSLVTTGGSAHNKTTNLPAATRVSQRDDKKKAPGKWSAATDFQTSSGHTYYRLPYGIIYRLYTTFSVDTAQHDMCLSRLLTQRSHLSWQDPHSIWSTAPKWPLGWKTIVSWGIPLFLYIVTQLWQSGPCSCWRSWDASTGCPNQGWHR